MWWRRLTANELVKGSFFIFIAQNAVNFGNLLYNLLMGRFLTSQDYGNLGAIMSLLGILGIPLAVFQLFIIKTVSSFFGKKEISQIYNLSKSLTSKTIIVGSILFLLLVLFSNTISDFLNLDEVFPIYILGFLLFFSFPITLNRSVLQGTLKFSLISINSFLEIGVKLLFSVILVYYGFKLYGALIGILLASFISLLLPLVELKIIFSKLNKNIKQISKFSFPSFETILPVLTTTAILTIFFLIDILWVRHFFDDATTSQYVALSTLGRIGFYAVGPIVSVMFPLISSRHSSNTPYLMPLLGTLVLSLSLSLVFIFAYFFFPKVIITLFYGRRFLEVAPLMGLFAFFMAIYSLNSILTHFLLSISYHKPLYFLLFLTLLQSIFILLYHQSLNSIIYINIIVSLIYLVFASYFVYRREKKFLDKIFVKIFSNQQSTINN